MKLQQTQRLEMKTKEQLQQTQRPKKKTKEHQQTYRPREENEAFATIAGAFAT